MASLREEIYNYISDGRHYDEYDDPIELTNDIIAIIEKHIASLKKGELYRAYNAALEDLEEILKK